jgi:hypothetical protein
VQFELQSLTCTTHPFAALLQVGSVDTVFIGGINMSPNAYYLTPVGLLLIATSRL